nr:MAG TPA: cyanase [Caudoviricetes sp.]
MKAIINEKMYDTTASSVIFADGTEALFKTKNGAYFKTSVDGKWLGVVDADAYIKEFGTVESA